MPSEDLEFQISQYADGSLPVEQRSAVENAVRVDPDAATILRQYQQLDRHLNGLRKQHQVNWPRLADHISSIVLDEYSTATRSGVAGRIVPVITSWRFGSAVAAVVLLALGSTLWVNGHRAGPAAAPSQAIESTAAVTGPQAELANGPAVQEITVGPSPALARQSSSWRYADGVVSHGPSKVTITAGITPAPRADPHLR